MTAAPLAGMLENRDMAIFLSRPWRVSIST